MNYYPQRPFQPEKYEYHSREEYPYSYSPIILFGESDGNVDGTTCTYSDRIEQWDRNLTDTLYKKHIGKNFHGDFSDADPVKVQAFLRERFNKPALLLKFIVEWCNKSNGYPYWSFYYND